MPPSVGTVALRLYDALAPLVVNDAENDYAALELCGAICDPLMQDVDDIVRDDDDYAGWERVLDPNTTPQGYLVYLGQFVGVAVQPQRVGESDAAFVLRAVAAIEEEAGFKRGRPAWHKAKIAETLTGAKTVFFVERQGGAYRLGVATRVSETPDPVLTAKVANENKAAGLILTVTTIVGGDYATFKAVHTDYADVKAQFPTYLDARNDPSLT